VGSEDDIRKQFGRIWPAHTANFTRFLIECRAALDGDLDLLLVLAVIGDRTFAQGRVDPAMDYNMFRMGRSATEPADINIRSISLYSGIPRETVRRKVSELVERGWVERKEDGLIVATQKAKEDLEPLTTASMRYLARMMDMFREV